MFDFSGSLAPLLTPFTDDGNGLSEVRMARQIQRLSSFGMDGFVVGTDVGEFTATSFSERKLLVEWVIRDCRGASPVLVNISSLSTSASLDLAQHAQRHGARAVVLMPPYYGRFTQIEHLQHIRSVQQYSQLPIIVVDPLKILTSETTEVVRELARIELAATITNIYSLAKPVCDEPSTYEWAVKGCTCSPIYSVIGKFQDPVDWSLVGTWVLTMRDLGIVRSLKAALPHMDLDLGPCRSPYMNLQSNQESVIRAVTMLTKSVWKKNAGKNPAA